ncbi:MAG TPA: TadE family protein [Terriglobia bacterium]|nr:TadE family protein [Terriglobia bacterium]
MRAIKRLATMPRTVANAMRRLKTLAAGSEGAALVEFAIIMPLLVVMAVGIIDFGAVYVLKDHLAQAAREGARIAVSEPRDLKTTTCTFGGRTYNTPCSVAAAMAAVATDLTDQNVTSCVINPAGTAAGNFTWNFNSSGSGCGGNPILAIQRNVQVASGNETLLCTRVTLNYPQTWAFASVIKLLVPSANFPSSFWLTASAVMPNLN